MYAPAWVRANSEQLERVVGSRMADTWQGSSFRYSLLALTAALLIVAAAAARSPRGGAAVYVLLTALAVFSANALFPHIAVAVALREYVPGVATAVACVLPVSAWVYVSTVQERYATRAGARIAVTAGVALYVAIVVVVLSA